MGEPSGTPSEAPGGSCPLWLKIRRSTLWRHKFKTCGTLMAAAGYVQNNLAQAGHLIPTKWHGAILCGAGAVVFVLGLIETLLPQDDDR